MGCRIGGALGCEGPRRVSFETRTRRASLCVVNMIIILLFTAESKILQPNERFERVGDLLKVGRAGLGFFKTVVKERDESKSPKAEHQESKASAYLMIGFFSIQDESPGSTAPAISHASVRTLVMSSTVSIAVLLLPLSLCSFPSPRIARNAK